jgi:hypothetical protein
LTFWTQESDLPWIELAGGMEIRFEAIDPATGAAVTGVTVSNIAVYGLDISGALGEVEDVIPAWTPNEVEEV